VVAAAPGPWAGVAGFTVLGLGLSVLVPQVFAAARGDAEVARLNVFNYVGFLVGAPLVGAVGEVWSHRGAMLVPMVLVLAAVGYARAFGAGGDRYGGGHERPHIVDVG
ncbi:MFS transporter, partial [Streptomyces solincola]